MESFREVINSRVFKLTSAGSAYTLDLPFQPDCIRWTNYTKSGTAAQTVAGVWYRGMPAGDAVAIKCIADNGATSNTNTNLETTNGITLAVAGGTYTNRIAAITGVTAADPAVVTSASHGLVDGDRVIITGIVGMVELNNQMFVVGNAATNTIGLYDIYGNTIDSSAFTAYSSGGKLVKLPADGETALAETVYRVTLGTSVMANASDVIYIEAFKADEYAVL